MKEELGSSFIFVGERNKDRQTDQPAKSGHWPNQLFVSCQEFHSTFVPLTKPRSSSIQAYLPNKWWDNPNSSGLFSNKFCI